MSKVDWSLAPDDATHWDACDRRINSFMKFDNGQWFYWPPASEYPHWCKWGNVRHDIEEMIERPKPKQWPGPEDGLPPVGTICEARILLPGQSNYLWRRCEVVYKNDEMSQSELLVVDIEKTTARWADEFRAIKTEEDIARDQRESAIRELMDIAQVDCRVTAARLVDAGFKREVV